MNIKIYAIIILLIVSFKASSQEATHISFLIKPELLKNANAVIRKQSVSVAVKSQNKAIINIQKTVTVLNQDGNNFGVFVGYYDKFNKLKNIKIHVFDTNGKLIQKVTASDIKDYPADDGFSLYKDDRVKYFKYISHSYPYTISISYTIESGDTIFLPSFLPIDDYNLAVERYHYKVTLPENLTWQVYEKNFIDFNIQKFKQQNSISYVLTNAKAIVYEPLMPDLSLILPRAYVTLEQFSLKGIKGQAENWNKLAQWYYQNLLEGRDEVTASTRNEIIKLTKGISDAKERARLVYEYMQHKTRYVSVQIGIGGWRPMTALEVDQKAYGDCKALVNYTKSLLKIANIPSNFTVVYGGKPKDIDENMVRLQGNHAILMVPMPKDTIWLECTSQKVPFGFIGGFTDDRKVFVIKPNAGLITKTKSYKTNRISQNISMTLDKDLAFDVDLTIDNCGKSYDDAYFLKDLKKKELSLHYKKLFGNIIGLSIDSIDLKNDKSKVCLTEKIKLKLSKQISSLEPGTYYFTPGVFSELTGIPASVEERHYPFVIHSNPVQDMRVHIKLPEGFKFTDLPKSKKITTEFGNCSLEIVPKNAGELVFKRHFEVKKDTYSKDKYKDFRRFIKKALKLDKKKIIFKNTAQ